MNETWPVAYCIISFPTYFNSEDRATYNEHFIKNDLETILEEYHTDN